MVEHVTRLCPEPGCDATFTGAPTSAGKQLSKHRQLAHGYVPPSAAGSVPRGTSEEAPKAATPISIAKAVADEGKPKKRVKIPTRDEWEKKLSLTLGIATTAHVARVVDRSRLDEELKEQYVDKLAMDDEECDALAVPFGGVIAEGPLAPLNKKFGRQALDVLDLLPAIIALVSYNARVKNFEREFGVPKQRRLPAPPPFQGATNGSRPQPSTQPTPIEVGEFAVYGPGSS